LRQDAHFIDGAAMEESILRRLDQEFSEIYGAPKNRLVIVSPGRVNLIGEHTDYNEGFVLPAAVDKGIGFIIAARNDHKCRLYASDFKDFAESDLAVVRKSEKQWVNYLLGVVDQMKRHGYDIRGFDLVFGGDIPIGAGMSSSAAVEGGLAFALNELFNLQIEKMALVKIAQKAENEFVGVQCGIMDQFANLFGQENKVIKLDCRSLDYEYYPFNRADVKIVLCDSQVKRELASSEYNVRRNQCEMGVRLLQKYNPEIRSLRDAPLELLEAHKSEFNPVVYKRCHYVIKENNRVLAACKDLTANDFSGFGKRMFESHFGLRNEFEVSSTELDTLVEIAASLDGVLGARLMGAGFGGCTINLVEEEHLDNFTKTMQKEYLKRMNKEVKIHVCKIQSGTARYILR